MQNVDQQQHIDVDSIQDDQRIKPVETIDMSIDNINNQEATLQSSNIEEQKETEKKYDQQLKETLQHLPSANTTFHTGIMIAGLCNQYMKFIGLMFLSFMEKRDEIIEESFTWKDTYGTNEYVSHKMLFDVVHWNTFYPTLPRFASHASFQEAYPKTNLQSEIKTIDIGKNETFAFSKVSYNVPPEKKLFEDIMIPEPIGRHPMQAKNKYKEFVKTQEKSNVTKYLPRQYEMYKTILKSAWRPHPYLQQIIDEIIHSLENDGKDTTENGYMTLHLRVEPDMGRENARICTQYRMMNVTQILEQIYQQFPGKPVNSVLIVFSRALMEAEAQRPKIKDEIHALNAYNLQVINELIQNGMWGGTVKVVEAGSDIVENSSNGFYKRYSNIAGSIVNFFLAIQSKIFIGTQISTYSTLVMNSRLFRENLQNYFYVPEGMKWMTPSKDSKPHWFQC